MFELIQTAELSHWRGEADDKIWRELIGDVRRHVERDAPGEPAKPAAKPPAAPPPARPGERGGAPSLAVLPFTNRSGLPEDDVFAFGMVEDLIEAMSHGLVMRVVSSSTVARFLPGGVPDLDAMARELGVRYVLEGNVRRVGESLRATTQIVETAGGNIVWTQRFERPLARLAELQEDLVLEVAAHLRTQARKLEIARALRKPADLTAWEAVMRSFAAFRRANGSAFLLAAQEARKAVEIAPDYGLALAQMSATESILYYSFTVDDPAEVERIRALAEKAMASDPENATVLATAAHALTFLDRPAAGLAAAQRAIELNRDNELACLAAGASCALLGRTDEAIAHLDREQALSPGNPLSVNSYIWRANAHERAGRWAEALAAYDQALQFAPDESTVMIGRAIACRQMGLTDEAKAALDRARGIDPETPLALWELRFGRGHAGGPVRSLVLDHLRALWAQ